jgi:hypothetical protein
MLTFTLYFYGNDTAPLCLDHHGMVWYGMTQAHTISVQKAHGKSEIDLSLTTYSSVSFIPKD